MRYNPPTMSQYTRGEFLGLSAALAGAFTLSRVPGTQSVAAQQQTPATPPSGEPDLIVVNARVYTSDLGHTKPHAEAFSIMMNVHRSGLGVAGIFTRDVADTKVRKTQQLAEEHEFPLLVTMEPEPENVNQ